MKMKFSYMDALLRMLYKRRLVQKVTYEMSLETEILVIAWAGTGNMK